MELHYSISKFLQGNVQLISSKLTDHKIYINNNIKGKSLTTASTCHCYCHETCLSLRSARIAPA